MCHESVMTFAGQFIKDEDVRGGDILEVGSRNVNGTVREIVGRYGPKSYCGVDLELGPCVDEVCNAADLVAHFGENRFDLVISTEMLEHAPDWRAAVSNMKRVLKPGRPLLLTTRSPGFPLHEYPGDHWRFTGADMRAIFSDFQIVMLKADPQAPGIFVKAIKPPQHFIERNLTSISVHSMT